MAHEPITILLIEGNAEHSKLIRQELERAGDDAVEVETRNKLATSLVRLGVGGVDAILMNLKLPDCEDGSSVTQVVQKAPKVPVVVFLGAQPRQELIEHVIRAGAQDFLSKSKISGDAILRTLRLAVLRQSSRPSAVPTDDDVPDSDAQIRTIIDAALDCIIAMDANGKIIRMNPAAEKTFGYRSKEVIGREMGELFMPPEVRERQRLNLERFQNSGAASMIGSRVEVPAFRKDGSEFIAEMATQGMRLDGEFVFAVFLRDISERKQHEEELNQAQELLRKERDLLRALMDHLPDLIFAKDLDGRFVSANAALLKILGISSPEQIVGKTDFDFSPEELARQYLKDDQKVMQSGQPMFNREEEFCATDGSVRWVLTTKVPLHDAAGKAEGLVGICRDITERKQWEEELERAKEAAELATVQKAISWQT